MLFLRSAARSAPRFTSQVARSFSTRPSLALSAALARRTSPSAIAHVPTRILSASISSSTRRLQASTSDYEELITKLEQEYKTEQAIERVTDSETELQKALQNLKGKGWEIKDQSGEQEVFLTKTKGDATMTVSFNVNDLNNTDFDNYSQEYPDEVEEADPNDPTLDARHDSSAASSSASSSATSSTGAAAAKEDADESFEDADQMPAAQFNLHIKVTRKGRQDALVIEATSNNTGELVIEEFGFLADGTKLLSRGENADAEKTRLAKYTGPVFANLDPALQDLCYEFLREEWGVTEDLTAFIDDYAVGKDQKEYLAWLKNVKNFLK